MNFWKSSRIHTQAFEMAYKTPESQVVYLEFNVKNIPSVHKDLDVE